MQRLSNSEIIKNIVRGTLIVSGRRTLKSFALKVVKTVIGILEKDFDFLKYIEIKDVDYFEGDEAISVSSMIDSVSTSEIGKAIEVFLKEIYTELKDEGGLYFISELKEYLGEKNISALENLGLNLDKIQSEQHEFFNQLEREKIKKSKEIEAEHAKKETPNLENELNYSWGDISEWEFDNNVVSLYSSDGELLDKIKLDLLIEDYVNAHTKFKDTNIAENMLNLNEKELEFLHMIHSRDIDIDFAKALLHISGEELDNIIQKLLEYEMLTHVSFDEVKITEKGINYLLEKK
jgi:hypothetical protein